MALDNDAVFTAAKGYILVGNVDAVKPTPQQIFDLDEVTLPAGYELVGHTSREDLPELGFDGGDTETKGTWQIEALRTVQTEVPIDYVTFNLLEFNKKGLALYYGVPEGAVANVLDVNTTPGGETQKSIIIVLVDGVNKVALHASKTGIRREDAIAIEIDEFAALPLRATFLKSSGLPWFSWVIGEDTV
jgi:hypothetical protein